MFLQAVPIETSVVLLVCSVMLVTAGMTGMCPESNLSKSTGP